MSRYQSRSSRDGSLPSVASTWWHVMPTSQLVELRGSGEEPEQSEAPRSEPACRSVVRVGGPVPRRGGDYVVTSCAQHAWSSGASTLRGTRSSRVNLRKNCRHFVSSRGGKKCGFGIGFLMDPQKTEAIFRFRKTQFFEPCFPASRGSPEPVLGSRTVRSPGGRFGRLKTASPFGSTEARITGLTGQGKPPFWRGPRGHDFSCQTRSRGPVPRLQLSRWLSHPCLSE